MPGVRVISSMVEPEFLFYKVTMLFNKSGQSAIGSVQSVDVVINVYVYLKMWRWINCCTRSQYVSIHSLLHCTQCIENMDLDTSVNYLKVHWIFQITEPLEESPLPVQLRFYLF